MNILEANQGYTEFQEFENKDWDSFWKTTGSMAKVLVFSDEARDESESMISDGNDKLAKKVWNLPDNKFMKKFVGLSLPSIKYSEAVFIPRSYEDYLKSAKSNKFNLPKVVDPAAYSQAIFKKEPYEKALRLRINSPLELKLHYLNKK